MEYKVVSRANSINFDKCQVTLKRSIWTNSVLWLGSTSWENDGRENENFIQSLHKHPEKMVNLWISSNIHHWFMTLLRPHNVLFQWLLNTNYSNFVCCTDIHITAKFPKLGAPSLARRRRLWLATHLHPLKCPLLRDTAGCSKETEETCGEAFWHFAPICDSRFIFQMFLDQ